MAREKIQIKKIDNATARQVTFSKRRRGLMKKAEELSILCDAEVALIVFSCNGKLCEFASSSMKGILERHRLHSKNLAKLEEPSLKLQLVENRDCARLNKEIAEKTRVLRQMRGEELHGLGIEDLQKLESTLESGLNCVLQKKSEKMMRDIIVLQERSAELVEENEQLKQQVEGIACGRKQLTSDSEYVAATNDEDGQSSESVINACNSSSHSPDYDYDSISAVSLRLGLPYRRCLCCAQKVGTIARN